MIARISLTAAVAAAAGAVSTAHADLVGVVGGETSVYLDFELLSSAASLDFSGVSPGVIVPGAEEGTVGFAITSPNAADLPTTFSYDTEDFFGTFSGTVEHRGAVYFNDNSIAVGNFTVGYRESGFYVGDNIDLDIALFDLEVTSAAPNELDLQVNGNLLVSSEFANLLLDLGLATSDLTGADVGDAYLSGLNQAVPGPAAIALLGLGGLFARRRRA